MKKIHISMFVVTMLVFALTASAGDKINVNDLLAKSVDAIGTADARAKIIGLNVTATGSYDVLAHGSGHLDGKATLISGQGRFQYVSDFNSPEYQGEQVTFEGGNVGVSNNGQTQQSPLAIFLYLHPYLVKMGLFGGVYNGGWPFIHPDVHPAKIHYDGLKKYNGRQLHQVTYDPKGSEGDMYIKLYFEPETFHHVATSYVYRGQAARGGQGVATVGPDVQESTETLDEEFGDFIKAGDLTLPTTWTIHYSATSQKALNCRWVFKFPNMSMLVKK